MTGRDGWAVAARTGTAEQTRSLAAALAPLARPGDVLLLVGGLGAGKTTFAQGFARALGIAGPVTSPTFTLVRQYPCTGAVRQLLHADVYRLETLAEVADLGLAELVEDQAVALVEWGDAAAPVLGPGVLRVVLEPAADGEARTVRVTDPGDGWADRHRAVEAAVAPFPPGPDPAPPAPAPPAPDPAPPAPAGPSGAGGPGR